MGQEFAGDDQGDSGGYKAQSTRGDVCSRLTSVALVQTPQLLPQISMISKADTHVAEIHLYIFWMPGSLLFSLEKRN